jgi:hypothetical protein
MSIKVIHSSGFFSCCSMRLYAIINYINNNRTIPYYIDSSKQFELYKNKEDDDITFDYFEHYDKIPDSRTNYPIQYHWTYQFIDYAKLDYQKIIPIVRKYFSPSKQINDIIKNIEQKYTLDYDNICVLFYRGNDKITEINLSKYSDYITYINNIIAKNPETKFLIQSDETEFIEKMTRLLPDKSFYFKDEIRHIRKSNNTVDKVFKETNSLFSKYFLAITIIMAKCKYIICGSGNCSIWMMFYRGNCNNVYQFLKNKLIIHPTSEITATSADVSIYMDLAPITIELPTGPPSLTDPTSVITPDASGTTDVITLISDKSAVISLAFNAPILDVSSNLTLDASSSLSYLTLDASGVIDKSSEPTLDASSSLSYLTLDASGVIDKSSEPTLDASSSLSYLTLDASGVIDKSSEPTLDVSSSLTFNATGTNCCGSCQDYYSYSNCGSCCNCKGIIASYES